MRISRIGPAALLALALSAQEPRLFQMEPIAVQKRHALVVGNTTYQNVTSLKNPANDAKSMAAELRRLQFDVVALNNLSRRDLARAIDQFTSKLASGDFGFFYFAGHGLQVQNKSYIVPVDYTPATEADVPYDTYPAEQLRDKMEYSSARLRVIVLDACRNNPFRGRYRNTNAGLAAMGSNAEGTYIAYATADNDVADDNPDGTNGLFTRYLIEALRTPGLDLKGIFERTKEAVYTASAALGRRQRPFTYDGVIGRFFFAPPVAPPPPDTAAMELALWNAVEKENVASLYKEYLDRYPNGQFASVARLRLAREAPPKPAPSRPSIDPARPVVDPAPPSRWTDAGGMEYVFIPPGTFQMGCSEGDAECLGHEKPMRQVTITRGFYIGKTEVSVAAYRAFARARNVTPPSLGTTDRDPVYAVEWGDAKRYCEWAGGRLPTEAELEYAARAGVAAPRYGPLDQIAWHSGNSGGKVHPLGEKLPNRFGLYDMIGNVLEWVADAYAQYSPGPQTDPPGPGSGDTRLQRGGAYMLAADWHRASSRLSGNAPGVVGIRCVRD